MATYNNEHRWLPWIVIAAMVLIGGYMDAQDANLMDRASVKVAQK